MLKPLVPFSLPALTPEYHLDKAVIPQLRLHHSPSPARTEIEQFISTRFLQVHQAQIHSFLPWLVEINMRGQTAGAYGLRPGQQQPLFLEQYLSAPIEQLVAEAAKRPVARTHLVEVGNLALSQKAFGPMLMVTLAQLLSAAGFEWMVFTATEQVLKLMQLLGFEPYCLCQADPQQLAGDQHLWGSYYHNNPQVMIGHLQQANQLIAQHPRLRQLAYSYADQIAAIASELRQR